MKRLFPLVDFLLILNCLLPPCRFALADDLPPYARADREDVYFCTKPDMATGLFAIPHTYGVEVLGRDGDWYRVRYAEDQGDYRALVGYCLAEELTPLWERPTTLWLERTLTVTYTADTGATPLPLPAQLQVDAVFYGTYKAGAATYSYVLCQGSFGYVEGALSYPKVEIQKPSAPTDEELPLKEDRYAPYLWGALGFIGVGTLGAIAVKSRGKWHGTRRII